LRRTTFCGQTYLKTQQNTPKTHSIPNINFTFTLLFSKTLTNIKVNNHMPSIMYKPLFSLLLLSLFTRLQAQSFIMIEPYKEGLAAARELEAWGFINTKGKWAIKPQFESVYYCSEGRVGFKIAGKWGFADTKGNRVIPPVFSEVRPFSEGLAAARNDKGQWGYLDKTGAWAIPAQYNLAQPFSEGMAAVNQRDRTFFIKKDGTKAFDGDYLLARDFKNGLAFVNQGGQHIWIDAQGNKVATCPGAVFYGEFAYSNGFDFSEERIAFKAKQGNVLGYMNRAGNIVIEAQYLECKSFYKGVAPVKTKNQNWILIDRSGKPLTDENTITLYVEDWPVDYLKASLPYDEGAAQPHFYGLLNLQGNWALKPVYPFLGIFSEGLVTIYNTQTQSFGCMNAKGKIKVKPKPSTESTTQFDLKVEGKY
jgi:WG containing repeat